MEAREIMTENPVCCTPMDTIRLAARQMRENNCGILPVVDSLETRHLIGVVTDRDIVCRVLADNAECGSAIVQQAMSSGKLWTVNLAADIDEVIEKMEEGQVRRIPVVDDGGNISGIISTADIALELDESDDIAEVFEEISEPTNYPRA